jgi:hypothetical protein
MSEHSKHTGAEAATAASKVLQDGRTADDSKAVAGSALSQADLSVAKHTSEDIAAKASGVLQSEETGSNSKSAAASALSQTNPQPHPQNAEKKTGES